MNRRTFISLAGAGVAASASAEPARGPQAGDRGPAVLLRGEFADPTVVRDGADFYMTHSHSDAHAPGLLVWHSKDLYRWTPLRHALEQDMGAVAAPEIVKHKDLFYIYFPARGSNWVVTAASPAGTWSEPVDLKVGGIDPGHVSGPDGKRYLHLNGGKIVELSDDGLSVKGPSQTNYAGWKFPESWVVECFCLESPKLSFHNGYYYLTSAQGGTTGPSTSHMIVSARSKSPVGPWENSPHNPVVHTWSAAEPWWSKGHGTLIDDGQGRWYLIYHAIENGWRNLGRQTLIEPVEWTRDGWFKSRYAKGVNFRPRIIENYATRSDDFPTERLNLQWELAGTSSRADYQVRPGSLLLTGAEGRMRWLQCRPSDRHYEVTMRLEVDTPSEIGLLLLYNPNVYAGIARKADRVYGLRAGRPFGPSTVSENAKYYKLRNYDNDLSLFYSSDGKDWTQYPAGTEVSGYNANAQGGFNSLRIVAYIKGQGNLSAGAFTYKSLTALPKPELF